MKQRQPSTKTSSFAVMLQKYAGSILLVILAGAFFSRVYRLHIPEKYMFDEVYHALTIKLIVNNDPRAYEWWNKPIEPDTAVDWLHPPTAKLIQAAGVKMFGATSFGWRVMSAITGVMVILVVYHFAKSTLKNIPIALLAAFLASMDGLLLVQSRIAMNDIFVTLFVLLALWQYWAFLETGAQFKIWFTGLLIGLAISSKWSGVFGLGVILGFETMRAIYVLLAQKWRQRDRQKIWLQWIRSVTQVITALLILPAVVYVLSYSQMWLQGKDFAHFKVMHHQIWYYQTHLDATHPAQSTPLEWVFNLKPVWYYVDYQTPTYASWLKPQPYRADIFASGNFVLYWLGFPAVIASLTLVITQLWKNVRLVIRGVITAPTLSNFKTRAKQLMIKSLHHLSTSPLFFISVAYFAVWLPWIFSPRIMFFYHYAPAVPLMSILLSYWLIYLFTRRSWWQKYLVGVILTGIVLCYLIWYPEWTGISVPLAWKNNFILWFPRI